jgi:RNA polymerase sigma-70 factor, ECF subfamily
MPDMKTDEFEVATSPHRRELFAHCYRMTGSVHDAEDLVQETYLRAWRAFERFEGRSSVRTWLYRIATNVCLTALERGRRRPLPSGLGPPSAHPLAPTDPTPPGFLWFEPVPDRLVIDESGDPADVVTARRRVRLALVAGLQLLPPRQRAALIFCEVLGTTAAEAAEMLDVSVAAVKSLLQRARARLAETEVVEESLVEPTDPRARRVLDRYLSAFEHCDMAEIERLLAEDATLEMTGTRTWFSGKATCAPFIAAQAIGRPGDWRMLPLEANGQLAAAAYRRNDDHQHHAFAVVVLDTTSTHLTRLSLFADPGLFPYFNLPSTVPAVVDGPRLGRRPATTRSRNDRGPDPDLRGRPQ